MTRVAGAQWRVGPKAEIALRDRDAGSLVGAPGDRATTEAAVAELQGRLAVLQSRLWAEGRRSLLVVLQGTDASGKDGTISHVFSCLDLLGTRVASFKEPTVEELAHDFLWRVHARCPAAGEIVIFNRSHYEDVLAARVRRLVAPEAVARSMITRFAPCAWRRPGPGPRPGRARRGPSGSGGPGPGARPRRSGGRCPSPRGRSRPLSGAAP